MILTYVPALALVVGLTALASLRADTPKPLSEADVLKLIELQRQTQAILARLKKAGVEFPVNAAVIARLRQAGASEEVLDALLPNKPLPEVITLAGKLGGRRCQCFSPDGKQMAASSTGTSVVLWHLPTNKRMVLEDHSGEVSALAFSRDGKTLAAGSYKQVKLWDSRTGKKLATLDGHTADVIDIVFFPDGKSFATASKNEALVWKSARDEEPETFKGGNWLLFPDGRSLANFSFFLGGNKLYLWDARTGRKRDTIDLGLSNSLGTMCAACSADGKRIALAQDMSVRVWDAATSEDLGSHTLHTGYVTAVELSGDGRTVLSVGRDKKVILWDVSTAKKRATLEGSKGVTAGYCREGKMVCTWSANDDTVRLWDAATGKELGSVAEKQRISLAVVSPDGKTLATATPDGIVRLRNIDAILRAKK